MTLNTEV